MEAVQSIIGRFWWEGGGPVAKALSVFELVGAQDLAKNLVAVGREMAESRLLPGLRDEVGRIQGIAQERAPRDTGQLRRNVRAIPTVMEWRNTPYGPIPISIEGGFHFRQIYAAIQHEHMGYRHDDGQAKYAESAILENREAFKARMAREVRAILGS